MSYPSQVEVEFEYTLEGEEEGEADVVLTVQATGDVDGPDHEVGYFQPHVAYHNWQAVDENGKVYVLKGHKYESLDRIVSDKLSEELASCS